jgi:hypothetical protein
LNRGLHLLAEKNGYLYSPTTVSTLKRLHWGLLGTLLLAIGLGGTYLYTRSGPIRSLQHLIPADALLLLRLSRPGEFLSQTASLPVFQSFLKATDWKNEVQWIQWLSHKESSLSDYLSEQVVFVSLHATTRHDFDKLYYLPLPSETLQQQVEAFYKQLKQDTVYKTGIRLFQGKRILEVGQRKQPEERFSFIMEEGFLVGSRSAPLVEDVIRTLGNGKHWQGQVNLAEAEGVSMLHISLNQDSGPALWQLFGGVPGLFKGLFQQASLQLEVLDKQLVVVGKTSPNQPEQAPDFLDTFSHQSPQALHCARLIPENTAFWYHIGISNAQQWFKSLKSYWHQYQPEHRRIQAGLLSAAEGPAAWLGQELALGRLESNLSEQNRFLILHSRLPQASAAYMKGLSRQADLKLKSPPFVESYSGYHLYQVRISELPALWLGNWAQGFPQCFYTEIDNYLVIASDLQTLHQLIDQYQQGRVWSKTQAAFLKKIDEKANFTCLVQVSKAWTFIPDCFGPRWQQKLETHQDYWRNFDKLALQVQSTSDGSCNLQGVAFYDPSSTRENLLHRYFVNATAQLDTLLLSPPYLFENPQDGDKTFLVQDKFYRLYCLNEKGKLIWKKPLPGAIEAPPVIRSLGKGQQALMIAGNELLAISRKGENFNNFPFEVPTSTGLHTLSVMDYQGNQDFRFMASDKTGDLYLYNKIGKRLEGWNPKHSGNRLSQPLQHVRINGKDYLMALQYNGTFQAWNRKGQSLSGFPVKLGDRVDSPFFYQHGPGPQEANCLLMTSSGVLTQLNLEGKILSRKQFERQDGNSRFALCPEEKLCDWVVVRQDALQTTLFDKEGNVLLQQSYENEPGNVQVQYYDFGSNTRIFFLTAAALKKTFVYDKSGRPIGEGFANELPVRAFLVESLNKLLIYGGLGREFRVVSVKIR